MPTQPLNIIITMAGNGERFRRAGYAVPKYRIEARGHTLFWWSMTSLARFFDDRTQVTFFARQDHSPREFLKEECKSLGIVHHTVYEVPGVTDGQATSALLAAERCGDRDAPLLIYNIDTYVDPCYLDPTDARGAGWIPCFPGEGDAWSFARTDAEGRVVELAEKKRISPNATIGLYWFDSVRTYTGCYQAHFQGRDSGAGERYIAPLYNRLIEDGRPVYLSQIPARGVFPLGTPAELEQFLR